MSYNPADYEARRRGYTQQYGATGAMNAYANFLAQQRGTRERRGITEQYDKAQPQLVAGYSRRGMVGPNVQSGLFARGLQDFAKQRARTYSEFDQGQQEQQRSYDLGEAQRLEAFRNQLADMESEKAQTIADAARQLYARRAGVV
tara:strand:+ start:212 stop:646 length:435 start_codon:yes stop_codon:yes gene_type:complete